MGHADGLSFLAGIGLFLLGIKIMGDGLECAAGSQIKRILAAFTGNPFLGVLTGAFVTALIQSSSATTVMVVGFVNAGLMTLKQATGVIMGANIGTTVTGVIIAMDLSYLAPVAIFAGVFVYLFVKRELISRMGQIAAGFGILFWGMDTMSAAMAPLGNSPQLMRLITEYSNPVTGILTGLLLTAVIQSSSASVGILQALASQGLVPIDIAVYVLYGQNIGTVVTALLASAASSVNSRRTAAVHLLFNLFGTIFFLLFTAFTPYTEWLKLLGGNASAQIAAAHIIFNTVTAALLFPLSERLIRLACIIVPDRAARSITRAI